MIKKGIDDLGKSTHWLKKWTAWLLLAVFISLPLPGFSEKITGHIEMSANKYRLGPGDVLSVQVYNQPDLAQNDILIRPDGSASFSGIGEVSVAGRTVQEITDLLEERIGNLVRQPQVTLTVTRTRPATVYLAGAVKHPGMYQLTTNPIDRTQPDEPGLARLDMRLSNILANAGGVLLNADLTHVEVRRQQNGEVALANLWQVLKEGNSNEDLWVEPGDTIFVPTANVPNTEDYNLLLRSSIGPETFPVRLIGQVGTPGVYELNGTSATINTAIARAGGYAPQANKRLVAIRRFEDGKNASTLYVDPTLNDVELQPNDVVYISESKTYLAGRFFEQAARILSPFTAISNMAWGLAGAAGVGGFRRFPNR